MNISVAMATYNGQRYLREQLNTIIQQLEHDDEIIICDDGSIDNTINIIEEYMLQDSRIRLFKNKRKGVVLNFQDAISKCSKEIIMLCDQDDIWEKNKVKVIKDTFSKYKENLVLHNAKNFYDNSKSNLNDDLIPNMRHGVINNLLKSSYWGCCMAFRRELLKHALPFPKNVIAHDQWIGLVAESRKEARFINEYLIKHRVHDSNVTKKLAFKDKLMFRYNLLSSLIKNTLK